VRPPATHLSVKGISRIRYTTDVGRAPTHDRSWDNGGLSPGNGCEGTVRTLYVRLSDPRRWVAVGLICDDCGEVHIGPQYRGDKRFAWPLKRSLTGIKRAS